MTIEYPVPSTAAPNYTEAAANTACLPSGWAETSASFVGVRVVEVRELWIPIPLDREQWHPLPSDVKRAKAPTVVQKDDLGIVLATIAAADAVGDLRRAFRPAFQVLDQYMLEGQWLQLQKVLFALLSEPYSIDLGVGALRFCSSARERILEWSKLVEAAKQRCEKKGVNHRLVLRGLI